MLLGVCVLVALGTWQLQRLAWKEDLITRIEQQSAVETAPLSREDLKGQNEFKTGTLRGRFLPDKDIRLIPRTYDGEPGAHILTPFITNEGATLLVNRGWVGVDKSAAPPPALQQDSLEISGMVRHLPRPNMFTPVNDPANDIWYRADLQEIMAAKNLETLAPVLFYQSCEDARRAPDPCGLALNISNDHRQYALFWFAMAGVLIAVYAVRFWVKR